MIHALDKTQNLAKEMQTELLCTRAANCPAHCLCSCSCGFLERLTLPPNGVLLILIPGVFFDRLEGYFVEDQFVGERLWPIWLPLRRQVKRINQASKYTTS